MLVQLRYPCLPQNSWTNPTKSIALKWLKRFWRAPFPISTTTAICLAECSVKLRNKTDDNTSRRIANTNTAIKSNYSCLCLARTQHFQKFCNLHFCSEITIDIQNEFIAGSQILNTSINIHVQTQTHLKEFQTDFTFFS